MASTLKLLAYTPHLDAATRDFCGYDMRTGIDGTVIRSIKEAAFAYFAKGFVNADLPRDSVYTDDISAALEGWAVADEQGNVVTKLYETCVEAENARANAKVSVTLDLSAEEVEQPMPEEPRQVVLAARAPGRSQ